MLPGTLFGIVGPNGSGKSTLLRVIGGVAKPRSGWVSYGGRDISKLPPKEAARTVAAVASSESTAFAFTVEEIVLMGRSPYIRPFASETAEDWACVRQAMEQTGVAYLRKRRITELSSGERQRVLIARALAQQPKALLLDEPTAHLDVNYQVEVMELALGLAHGSGITTIAVLHDLNLAARYCDRIVMMRTGELVAEGVPRDVLTEENLLDVYGVRAVIGRRPELDRPAVFVMSGSPAGASAGSGSGSGSGVGVALSHAERAEHAKERRGGEQDD